MILLIIILAFMAVCMYILFFRKSTEKYEARSIQTDNDIEMINEHTNNNNDNDNNDNFENYNDYSDHEIDIIE